MKRLLIATIILLLWASPAMGCIGTRAASMGYAGVACADDSTVVYWNSALLSEVPDGYQFQYDTKPMKDDFDGTHIVSRRAMTFSYKCNHIGFCYVENLDREYWKIGTGHKLTDKLSLGIGLDLTSIDYGRDFVWTVDCSANYRFNENWNVAILCQSIGESYTNYRPSIAFTKQNTTVCFEYYDITNNLSNRHLRLGFEQKISNLYARLGMNDFEQYLNDTNKDCTVYYGLAYQLDRLRIDISTIQDNSYSLGIIYKY